MAKEAGHDLAAFSPFRWRAPARAARAPGRRKGWARVGWATAVFIQLAGLSCGGQSGAPVVGSPAAEEAFAAKREAMVRFQLAARDVDSTAVLAAMRTVPRHKFVPPDVAPEAYEDYPLPIGHGQTISQPYIVGIMTQLLQAKPGGKVLEVGTGSGYQAAVLAEMGCEVYTIEIIEDLADSAAKRLAELGYKTVHVRAGDGYQGWPQAAPFDGIIVTAAPDHVPQPLVDQLKTGARMVIPVGEYYQQLRVITRASQGLIDEAVLDVRFVPMTGEAQKRKR